MHPLKFIPFGIVRSVLISTASQLWFSSNLHESLECVTCEQVKGLFTLVRDIQVVVISTIIVLQ